MVNTISSLSPQRSPSPEKTTPRLTTETALPAPVINLNSSQIKTDALTARCGTLNTISSQPVTNSPIFGDTASVLLNEDIHKRPEKAARHYATQNQPHKQKNQQKEEPAHKELTSYPIPPYKEPLPQMKSGTDIFDKKDIYNFLEKYKIFIDKEKIFNAKESIEKIEKLEGMPSAIMDEIKKMHQSIMSNFAQLKEKDQKTISLQEKILAANNESSKQAATLELLTETQELTELHTNLQKNNEQLISNFQNWLRKNYKIDPSLISDQLPASIHEHNNEVILLTSHNAEASQNVAQPPSPPLTKSQLKKQSITLDMVRRHLPPQTKIYENAIYQNDMENANKAMQEMKTLVNSLKGNKASGKKFNTEVIIAELDAIHTQVISPSNSYKNLLLKLFHLLDKEIWN